jgi:hypothetical protein
MRNVVRPVLLGVTLLLAGAAAHAQPAPERSARCRAASLKYLGPSPDKKHLTVEAENEYEYRGAKKYLTLCSDMDDALTLSVKVDVAAYEAGQTLERLLPAASKAGSPESKDPDAYAAIAEAYEAQRTLLVRWRLINAYAAADAGYMQSIDERTDLLIDAYARAVAACGARAECRLQQESWTQKLAEAYRSRHDGSDAGLEEFKLGALARPLPQP